jgi:hypothetical protein
MFRIGYQQKEFLALHSLAFPSTHHRPCPPKRRFRRHHNNWDPDINEFFQSGEQYGNGIDGFRLVLNSAAENRWRKQGLAGAADATELCSLHYTERWCLQQPCIASLILSLTSSILEERGLWYFTGRTGARDLQAAHRRPRCARTWFLKKKIPNANCQHLTIFPKQYAKFTLYQNSL